MLPKLTLVLGGAASGKSAWAEALLERAAHNRVYLATGAAQDTEMSEKILAHRQRRGAGWVTVEAPLDLGPALAGATAPVLVDCATFWLMHQMEAGRDPGAAGAALVTQLAACPAPVVIVSNELGLSVVPENALARRFQRAQGALNQTLAAAADCVVFVAAGLPMALKGGLP